MYFNSGSNSLVDFANDRVKANNNTYPLLQKARSANHWLAVLHGDIAEVSTTWAFDDTNLAGLPFGGLAVTAGTNYVDISGYEQIFSLFHNNNGNYTKLAKVDSTQEGFSFLLSNSATSTPLYYDLVGKRIYLYPTPSTTSSTGLLVYGLRGVDLFTWGDTTKEPGFASTFHYLIGLGMAFDYALDNNKPQKNDLWQMLQEGREALQEFYSSRERDEVVMKPAQYNPM